MAYYRKSNISLEEAMSIEHHDISRVWVVSELKKLKIQLPGLPSNAKVLDTYVTKRADGNTFVGVHYTMGEDPTPYNMSTKFPQFELDKLQKEFPDLFKLTGNLYIFE